VLAHGTGAINVDGCRIPFAGQADFDETANKNDHAEFGTEPGGNAVYGDFSMVPRTNYRERIGGGAKGSSGFADGYEHDGFVANTVGRWPANVILTDAVFDDPDCPEVVGGGTSTSRGHAPKIDNGHGAFSKEAGGGGLTGVVREDDRHFELGGKSRYFLIPKASRRDRNGGLPEGETNRHETVKPQALMEHLVRLVTPPGGTCLDPFMGSGTTGRACQVEGVSFIGIERDPGYFRIASARIGVPDERAA
jgi:site-specific DNA-methyltransferase (adenine-specific)